MKTNFEKLTRYESAVIGMIALGLLLIGFEIFVSLPEPAQANVRMSVAILDLHVAAQNQTNQYGDMINLMTGVYDEINLAFVQTMTLPEEMEYVLDQTETAYQKSVVFVRNLENDREVQLAMDQVGRVLGISVDAETAARSSNAGRVEEVSPMTNYFVQFTMPPMDQIERFIPLINY